MKQVRILLLGAGESGKSTFLKQMRIIHNLGFDPDTVRDFQHVIYLNCIQGMRVLVDAQRKLGIPWENPQNSLHGDILLNYHPGFVDQWTFTKYVPSIRACWSDEAIRKAFSKRSLFQISDSVEYFFENMDRITHKDWIPTYNDIIHARRATKGIYELMIPINRVPFHFIDVGGQRSQRAKWLQCFDSITSILFLVASSEFDQVLLEDRTTNRLEESRTIFDAIVNNRIFLKVSMILFLNKSDLLRAKLARGIKIADHFPSYTGDNSLESVQAFILNSFTSLRRHDKSALYYHFTTAIDTENIRIVFNAVKSTILKQNLANLMLE
ncbi:Guanine nucleotide-binding protein subunit alpha-12 [Orchesella cincta]|uniref:Guanine nucleotide-binding protein subunit alpha-12 n=1 Tax=Orchesella cincta TaxID=48709 RepID=A0A1D2NLS5_ORCCI|nr:Guanine nucleotide-binding protein subunit alpha-12 [Orchesella cincta]